MDMAIVLPILKIIGANVFNISQVILLFWLFITATDNKKKIGTLDSESQIHSECIVELKTMCDQMNPKLDRLIDIHLNGKGKRK